MSDNRIRNALDNFIVCEIIRITEQFLTVACKDNVSIYSKAVNSKGEIIGFVSTVYDESIDIILISNHQFSIVDRILLHNEFLNIAIHQSPFGSIIAPTGEMIKKIADSGADDVEEFVSLSLPIFKEGYPMSDRKHLSRYIMTGYNSIDILYPIGYGQRMIIAGDTDSYKTQLCLNIVSNIYKNTELMSKQNVFFVYVTVGQRALEIDRLYRFFVDNDVAERVSIIYSPGSDRMGRQMITPMVGIAIAEHYASKYGYDVIVIFDDLVYHAVSYRELNLVRGVLPGRESYPSDIFYLHSRLLERPYESAKGSITALVVVETMNKDLAAYIPTNIISITDGQIVLDGEKLRYRELPPIDTSLSISRVGSAVQHKMHRRTVSLVKKAIALYRKNLSLYNMGIYSSAIADTIRDGLYVQYFLTQLNEQTINCIESFIHSIFITSELRLNLTIEELKSSFISKVKNIITEVYSMIENDPNSYNQILNNTCTEEIFAKYSAIIIKKYNSK